MTEYFDGMKRRLASAPPLVRLLGTDWGRKYIQNPRRKRQLCGVEFPSRLIIEPASACNYRCPKCLYPEMSRPHSFMQVGKYEAFLKSWNQEIGAFRHIELTGAGEALLNPELVEIVRISNAVMPHARVAVDTNLALLTAATAAELLDAGLGVWQVSIDSIDAEEYRAVTGGRGQLDQVLANTELLWKMMAERGDGGFELVINAHRPFDSEYEARMRAITHRLAPISHRIVTLPYQTLNQRKLGAEYESSEAALYAKYRVVCDYLWTDLVVLSDGTVRMCCADMFDSAVSFGNILTETPTQVLENPVRQRWLIDKVSAKRRTGPLLS